MAPHVCVCVVDECCGVARNGEVIPRAIHCMYVCGLASILLDMLPVSDFTNGSIDRITHTTHQYLYSLVRVVVALLQEVQVSIILSHLICVLCRTQEVHGANREENSFPPCSANRKRRVPHNHVPKFSYNREGWDRL